jgi:hypothetical protein
MSDGWTLRAARAGDGQAVFDVTLQAIRAQADGCYSAGQIAGWMGERAPNFYEALIAAERMTVAERSGAVVGFVDAEPGEVTRLFVAPQRAGGGLGSHLLRIVAGSSGPRGP